MSKYCYISSLVCLVILTLLICGCIDIPPYDVSKCITKNITIIDIGAENFRWGYVTDSNHQTYNVDKFLIGPLRFTSYNVTACYGQLIISDELGTFRSNEYLTITSVTMCKGDCY
jgi:hypothetical protein